MNFPGSKKAAKECMEIIEGCILHAVSLILDRKSEVKKTHEIVQGSEHSGCSCSSGSSSKPDSASESAEADGCGKLTSSVSIFEFLRNAAKVLRVQYLF